MNALSVDACQSSSELGLKISRTFAAPRHAVYHAWTTQEALRHWAAPSHFVIIEAEGNCRPGGMWHCCMIAPDGTEYRVGGVYREVSPDERLAFTHVWDEEDGPGKETLVTVSFHDEAGGTRMDFEQGVFASAQSRDGHAGGWNECFNLLERYLTQPPHHEPVLKPFR